MISRPFQLLSFLAALILVLPSICLAQTTEVVESAMELKVMTWNLFQSQAEGDRKLDVELLAKVVKDNKADVLTLQNAGNVSKTLADKLGYHLLTRGKDLAILSRYPVSKDISVFEDSKCAGALLELPGNKKLAVFSIWLPGNLLILQQDPAKHGKEIRQQEVAIDSELEQIVKGIDKQLAKEDTKLSVVVAGEFNSMSHLDYSHVYAELIHQPYVWAPSRRMASNAYRDSFREANHVVHRISDATQFSETSETTTPDRTSFIYYRSDWLRTSQSSNLKNACRFYQKNRGEKHGSPDQVPVLSSLKPQSQGESPSSFRVVSYNIKHGHGMDHKVDLGRTAKVLARLKPDFVGLQEVDLRVDRSSRVNQPMNLSSELKMHAAFGKFMDYQNGQYGMGILSKHPIIKVDRIELPEGNEPRIALVAEVLLPDNSFAKIVNVHFDWVRDDKFRLAQAKVLAKYLSKLEMPYILLGDFNDGPESETLKLFRENTVEAVKPRDDRFTISSTNPRREIDFIFAGPTNRWIAKGTRVVDEKLASDHRPVVTTLKLKPAGK